MSDTTTVLYALSTVAQTCAALAAFVGAVGLFRLQSIRDRAHEAEREMRALAPLLKQEFALTQSLQHVFESAMDATKDLQGEVEVQVRIKAFYIAVRDWLATEPEFISSRRALFVFEAWNLLVIGVALVGFNYVPALASWPGTFWAIWVAAVGTVGVTGYCVLAWTRK